MKYKELTEHLGESPEDLEEARQSEEGAIPETGREEELAKKHGNRKRITFGDVLKARQESARKKEMKEEVEELDELKKETYTAARKAIAKKLGELEDDEPVSYHPWPSMMKKEPKVDMSKEVQRNKLAQSFARAAAGEMGRRPVKRLGEDLEELSEVLKASDPVEKWIKDFVASDNPKFEGKSKKERIDMALGAYYAAQKEQQQNEMLEAQTYAQYLDNQNNSLFNPFRISKGE